MANNIVTVNVTQEAAPAPSTLQQTGAIISQGGTTLGQGNRQLLTAASDLTSILTAPAAITSAAWNANVVTITTTAPHGFTIADVLNITIAGFTPSEYNGTFACTITGASTFTYALTPDPGADSVQGTFVLANAAELLSMVTTFFDQGSQQSVYVFEMGDIPADDAVTYLDTWTGLNPGIYYAYLVPRDWADEAGFITLVDKFLTTTSRTYFFTTVDQGNYTDFADKKSVVTLIEAPAAPVTEFSQAADFWRLLSYDPSATSKVTPFAFGYMLGVTAYPTAGNGALLAALKAAFVNYVGVGAEGGISNTILFWGTTMDGRDLTYWYSVDWVQINVDLDVANAVINGSNNPTNPLYYNQDGINRLQAVAAAVMSRGVSFGLVLNQVQQTAFTPQQLAVARERSELVGLTVVNAVPFLDYLRVNPTDFPQGEYGGFTIVYTPNRGFTQIIFNVNVTDFVAQ